MPEGFVDPVAGGVAFVKHQQSQSIPKASAENANDESLGEKQPDDLRGPGAERPHHANFPPLLHGEGDHGIHHAEGRHDGDHSEDEIHHGALIGHGLELLAMALDPRLGSPAERKEAGFFNLCGHGRGVIGISEINGDAVHGLAGSSQSLSGFEGNIGDAGLLIVIEYAGDSQFLRSGILAVFGFDFGLPGLVVFCLTLLFDDVNAFVDVAGPKDIDAGLADGYRSGFGAAGEFGCEVVAENDGLAAHVKLAPGEGILATFQFAEPPGESRHLLHVFGIHSDDDRMGQRQCAVETRDRFLFSRRWRSGCGVRGGFFCGRCGWCSVRGSRRCRCGLVATGRFRRRAVLLSVLRCRLKFGRHIRRIDGHVCAVEFLLRCLLHQSDDVYVWRSIRDAGEGFHLREQFPPQRLSHLRHHFCLRQPTAAVVHEIQRRLNFEPLVFDALFESAHDRNDDDEHAYAERDAQNGDHRDDGNERALRLQVTQREEPTEFHGRHSEGRSGNGNEKYECQRMKARRGYIVRLSTPFPQSTTPRTRQPHGTPPRPPPRLLHQHSPW